MTVTKAHIERLMRLARIECSEEEEHKLEENLQKLFGYIDLLSKVATDGVEPCVYILNNHTNCWNEDTVAEPLSRELFLSNAPAHVAGMVRVPLVVAKS